MDNETEGSESTVKTEGIPIFFVTYLIRVCYMFKGNVFSTFFALQFLDEVKEGATIDPSLLLYKAAKSGNLAVMAEAVALDADRNWIHPTESSSPLHQAILGV